MNNDTEAPERLYLQLMTLFGHAGVSIGIKEGACKSPGAQYYKCAFQVNPFGYLGRHAKPTSFTIEADYNTAMVEACRTENIRVVGITDHFRIATAQHLAAALTSAGILVFPGFEASSSEGVHLLCLFPPTTSFEEMA